MARRLNFLFLFFLTAGMNMAAGQIRVVVQDDGGMTLPYVNAVLIDEAGDFDQLGTSGDEIGLVVFNDLETGRYDLILYYLGYNTDTIRDIFVDAESGALVDIGTHIMDPKSTLLGTVDIVGQAPLIIREANNLIYNIEKTTLATGESALSLMNNVPGVMVNSSSEILVNGKKDVVVFIDGRQQYLSGNEMAGLLRSLSSETIKQVEVKNSASAKYDAGAGSSVIDIILKRASYSGVNGSVWGRYRQGRHASGNGGSNLNWKYKKFSGNLYYAFNYYQGFHDISMNRVVDGLGPGGDPVYFRLQANEQWTSVSHAPRMRLFYDIDQNHRIGIQADLTMLSVDFPNENFTEISNDGVQTDSIVFADIQNDESKLFPSVNFTYHTVFGEGSSLIDISYDFFYYDYDKKSKFENQLTDPDMNPLGMSKVFREDNPLLNQVHTASFDFSKSLKREHFLDVGSKVTFIDKMSETRFEDLVGDSYIEDTVLSRTYDYKESIYAAYVNWGKDFVRDWSVEMGMRVEHTRIEQSSVNPVESAMKNYWDVFPYVNLFKTSVKDQTISFSYARKLLRPSFNQLNPFILDLNPFLVSSGDPDLIPQINNIVDFEFTFKNDYSFYASYILANHSINSVFLDLGDGRYNLTYLNFDRSHFFNAGFSVTTDVNEWWSLNINANAAFDAYNASIEGSNINRKGASASFTVNNQFSMPKEFYLDMYGTFESPRYTSIEYYKSNGRLDVSLTKYFLDKALSVKIKGRDLFYTSKYESSLDYLNLNMDYLEKGDSRRFELSVSYNFQAGEKFKNRKNNIGNKEEKIRTY
ncbi:MAG: outer membrane beta-barrel protein [Bacteroidetes bacterium]|nr:outer membrane beta-barrel protein [Bacteroidota bacterium]